MPHRIISLVPSITLLLFDLGLEKSVVGRTKFCIHPAEKVKHIPTIGGTKNVSVEKVKALQPTLVIVDKEENEKELVESIKAFCKVEVFDVKNIADNYKMIAKIGKLTNTESKAKDIIEQTKENFNRLHLQISYFSNLQNNMLYLIWRKPYMTIGKDTFIHSVLEAIGLKNMFSHRTRYPIIENLQTSYFENCRFVLLPSEPYPFTEKHVAEIQQQLPHAKIHLVDGEYFSWYGSKMLHAPVYFNRLLTQIHPNP